MQPSACCYCVCSPNGMTPLQCQVSSDFSQQTCQRAESLAIWCLRRQPPAPLEQTQQQPMARRRCSQHRIISSCVLLHVLGANRS